MNYLMKRKIVKKAKAKKYQQSGLTLIEMVVSLAVVMFIATIFIFNYRDNNKRTDLIMASQVMVSDIHRAQNNSLGLLQYGDVVPSGGWGVYFDLTTPDRYTIFPDLQDVGETGYHDFNPETEGDINKGARVIELAPEIEIDSIYLGCLLYTSPSPRDRTRSRMPSSA